MEGNTHSVLMSSRQSTKAPKLINIKLSENISELIINQPQVFNALDSDYFEEFLRIHLRWQAGQHPKVVFLSGAGNKGFSAGGDVKGVYLAIKNGDYSRIRVNWNVIAMKAMNITFNATTTTSVNIWSGIVMGGAVAFTMYAPIRIATDTSILGFPESGIGYFPDAAAVFHLSRLKGNPSLGLFLALTGLTIKGKELVSWGFATHFVQEDDLQTLKNKIIALKSLTASDIFDVVNSCSNRRVQEDVIQNLEEINYLFQCDSIQQIVKRISESTSAFSKQIQLRMTRLCPLSLCVIFEYIKRARFLTFNEILHLDYVVYQRMLECGSFFEGVRAMFIDKDNKPQWKHLDVNQVTVEEVKKIFTAGPELKQLCLEVTSYDLAFLKELSPKL